MKFLKLWAKKRATQTGQLLKMKKMTSYRLLTYAAFLGAAAVAIGAFGAHGLKPRLSDYQISIFEKGVQYHFYHTMALLVVGVLLKGSEGNRYLSLSGLFFISGILCFSGSLYLLACRDLISFSVSWAGPVTPLGGLFFIAAWVLLAWGAAKNNFAVKQ
jgi:uncharacterized membrane protein YgdD (TMEM256/DUF423 family)